MFKLDVSASDEGMRLDALIALRFQDISRAEIKRFIDSGNVIRNDGKKCTKGDKVSLLYTYFLTSQPTTEVLAANSTIPIEILYEDDVLIALNKPAGINCQPNKVTEIDTLANGLLAICPELQGVGDGPLTCGILHRIDFDTSGLVLVAKNQDVYKQLREQFAARTVEKHYVALVSGILTVGETLEHQLAHNPRCPGRMVDASLWNNIKRPMRAVTTYEPVQQTIIGTHAVTLLDVTIFTGVTHQIRAQLSFSGHPIVGDKQYGGLQVKNFKRHFLHASSAKFLHPVKQKMIMLKAPLTQDLKQLFESKSF